MRDMLCASSAKGAEYLLVSAYALAVHDVPRSTGDLDIWTHNTTESASRRLMATGAP